MVLNAQGLSNHFLAALVFFRPALEGKGFPHISSLEWGWCLVPTHLDLLCGLESLGKSVTESCRLLTAYPMKEFK